MATLFRPPLIFRRWLQDPGNVAASSQSNVAAGNNFITPTAPPPIAQKDWPVPKGPTYAAGRALSAQADVQQDRNPTLLLGQDALTTKRNNYDWPNPIRPVFAAGRALFAVAENWTNRLVNLLVGQDSLTPNRNDYDWPNPTLPKSRQAAIRGQDDVTNQGRIPLFTGQDSTTAGGNDYDWPNPLRPIYAAWRAIQSEPDVWQNLLGTLLVVATPFTPVDRPNPKGWPDRTQAEFAQPQGSPLVLTTLAGQDALLPQRNVYDYPNPRGLTSKPYLDPQPLNLVVNTKTTPFFQTEWPNPRGPYNGIAQLSFYQQIAEAEAPLQIAQYDWPNPRGPTRNPAYEKPVDLSLLGQDQTTAHGNAYDWPNPRGATRNPDWIAGLNLAIFGQDQTTAHGNAYDWPNPRGYENRVAQLPFYLSIAEEEAPLPIAQYDWPNPRGPRRNNPDWIAPLNLCIFGQDQFTAHGNCFDWLNPRGPFNGIAQVPFYQNVVINGLPAPFFQTDWPNPRGATRNPDWALPLNLAIYGKDQITASGNNYDWPNPRGAVNRVAQLPFAINPILFTTSPFYQTNWPNPQRQRQPQQFYPPNLLGTTLAPAATGTPLYAIELSYKWLVTLDAAQQQVPQNLLLTTLAPTGTPFFQTDWPNPVLPISRYVAVTAQPNGQSPTIGVLALGTPVTAQHDWPNPPLGPVNRIYLLHDRPALQSLLPPTPVPFNQTDWPVPKGAPNRIAQSGYSLQITYAEGVKPFLQTDWPVPKAKLNWVAYQQVPQTPPGTGSTTSKNFNRLVSIITS